MTSCIPRLQYSTNAFKQKLLNLVRSSTLCGKQCSYFDTVDKTLANWQTGDTTHDQHNYLCDSRLSPWWN